MANARITITFDSEKLAAIRQLAESGTMDIDAVLQEQLEKIYIKTVPAPVRQYIDGREVRADNSLRGAQIKGNANNPRRDAPPNTRV